ncbi:hypothetical protein OIO90_003183 [Microbotryomycetes sp. JL221]|nr:hypothetical protein OIO90_003183 [Microbotryomycetes sp. JL221]
MSGNSRKRNVAPPSASSDSDDDDDYVQHSTDEEEQVGSRSNSNKASQRNNDYKSVPTSTRSSSSTRPPAPVDSDEDDELSSGDNAAQQTRKQPRSNPVATARPGPNPRTRTRQQVQKENRWWLWLLIGGLLLVLLAAAAFLIYKLVNKDNSAPSTGLNSTSSDTTDSALSMIASQSEFVLSDAMSSGEAASATSEPVTRLATAELPMISSLTQELNESGLAVEPSGEALDSQEPSTHLQPTLTHDRGPTDDVPNHPTRTQNPTPTQDDIKPDKTRTTSSTTQTVQVTWFSSDQGISTCLSKTFDHDYVVHVSAELYGKLDRVSSRCGQWISVWSSSTNQTLHLTIEGVCERCAKYDLDLSARAFYELTGDSDIGIAKEIQWWYTDEDDKPEPSIESFAPTAFQTKPPKPKQTVAAEHEVAQAANVHQK